MSPTVDALQAALATEHAAIYGYGALGAHLTGSTQEMALTVLDEHRTRRDELAGYLTDLQAQPVAAAAAYKLPRPATAHDAAQLGAALEERVMVAYVGLTGAPDTNLRRFAALAMQGAITWAVRWRGSAQTPSVASAAFPGLPASALTPRKP